MHTLLLQPPLLRLERLPLLPLPLLLGTPPLLLTPALGLPPLRLLGDALPRAIDPWAQLHAEEHRQPQRLGEARLPPRTDLPPLRLQQPHHADGPDEAAAGQELPRTDALLRRGQRRRQLGRGQRHHGQGLGGPPHVHLSEELRQIVAEAHRVPSADPALADDATHDLVELLRRGHGALGAHALHSAQLAGLEEEPRHAQGPVLLRHLVGKHQGLDEGPHAVALEARRQEVPEAHHDLLEGAAVGVAVVHDLDELHGAALDDLVQHQLALELVRPLLPVGLEAADVVQVAGAQRLEERLQVPGVLLRDALEQRRARGKGVLVAERLHQRVRRVADELLALREQPVVVLVQPAGGLVLDLPGVVLDDEAFVERRAGSALPPAAAHFQLLQDVFAHGVLVRLVQDLLAEAPVRRLAHAIHQVLAVLVERLEDLPDGGEHRRRVGQRQAGPRQALALVQLLLSTEYVLDEVLLEPLVREVDAELLEGVVLQVLEAVDVEDADVPPALLHLLQDVRRPQLRERVIDPLHCAVEDALVDRLDEALQGVPEVGRAPGHLVEGAPAPHGHLPLRQPRTQLRGLHAEQHRRLFEGRLV
mmetsp:Transcript_117351/g.328467  ORF Transcript_117351/g.328467 Transcript_117351/m.328467 type:complete len:590 (-) Transcript_117351:1125-2894(-)